MYKTFPEYKKRRNVREKRKKKKNQEGRSHSRSKVKYRKNKRTKKRRVWIQNEQMIQAREILFGETRTMIASWNDDE